MTAAAELFYRHGIPNVGVNDITRHAGVAKQSLYNNFDSKDALLLAVLERRARERHQWLRTARERAARPADQLIAVFDLLHEWFATPNYRGCAFVNATVELAETDHPAGHAARAHKDDMRLFFQTLAEEARLRHPARVAQHLMLLVDGATALALVQRSPEPALSAKQAAAILIDHARSGA